MNDDDLSTSQARRATALAYEYDALMGLSSAAMGGGLVLGAITGQVGIWLALGVVVSACCTGWYYRRFGFVRQRSDRQVLVALGTAFAFVVLMTAAVLDRWLLLPVSLMLLSSAGLLAVGQGLMLRRMGLTALHWLVYAALVVAAVMPLWGLGASGPTSPFVLAALGLSLIALGLTDHLRLVRALVTESEVEDGR